MAIQGISSSACVEVSHVTLGKVHELILYRLYRADTVLTCPLAGQCTQSSEAVDQQAKAPSGTSS